MKTVILCGGSGTRLWPLSTPGHPKQFVSLFNNQSLFELTLNRNAFLKGQFLIVTNTLHEDMAKNQSQNFSCEYILESAARNTAPAIALAALSSDPEEILLVLPSDHLITNQTMYEKVIQEAITLAKNNFLVTFGITANKPETGYGYIKYQNQDVLSFKEKPDFETAVKYLEEGNYLWNSGMFCFKAKTFLEELKNCSPEIYHAAKTTYEKVQIKNGTYEFIKEDMLNIPADSIDYAVMEKSKKVKVVPADISWHDLGSFESLFEVMPKDEMDNVINEDNVLYNSKKNLCYTQIPTVLLGVEDLIVVQTDEGLLVTKKGQGQEIKEAIKLFKAVQK